MFEYAVIRIVPRVEREEFVNTGVILYCPKVKFLRCIIDLDEARVHAFAPQVDVAAVRENLHALESICHGIASGGVIASLEPASRFRWLTATRSTIIQSSKVHPGLCAEPSAALQKLYEQLVKM